uniref:Uncharacterized protein n=1 Tax=Anguilla anguilla TaxID=7936 RepID=A0A0E9WMV3_ANGAN
MSTSCQSLLELDIYIKVGLSDNLMWEVVMRKLTVVHSFFNQNICLGKSECFNKPILSYVAYFLQNQRG